MLRMFIKVYNQRGDYVGYSSTNFDRLNKDIVRDIQYRGIDNISRIDVQLNGKVIKSLNLEALKYQYAS